jgi:hypothetical protein
MDAATGSQKHFVSLLDVGDIGSSTARDLTTLGPSVGDDGNPSRLGPSVSDDEIVPGIVRGDGP